jgi:hypothetical protein
MTTDEGALTVRQRRVIVERIQRSLTLAMKHWDSERGGEWLKEIEKDVAALRVIQATDLRLKCFEVRVSARN